MDGDEGLPKTEEARDRRRDRDAGAHARAGMKTGLAKLFKQVLDAQRKRAMDDEAAAAGDSNRSERRDRPSRPKRRRA